MGHASLRSPLGSFRINFLSVPDDFFLDATSDSLLTRVHDPEGASRRFSGTFGRLIPALARSDSPADQVIREFSARSPHELHAEVQRACGGSREISPALLALVDECATLTSDIDETRLERAGMRFEVLRS